MREWLIENGFQGKDGQSVPEMSEEYCIQWLKDTLNCSKR